MKLKFFTSSLIISFLIVSLTINISYAYKVGQFLGVGDINKWQAACKIYNVGNHAKTDSEKEKFYKKAISIYPFDACFWFNYANCSDCPKIKIKRLKMASELNSKDYLSFKQIGIEYIKIKEFQKASDYIIKSINLKPDEVANYSLLEMCFDKLKNSEKSIYWAKKGYTNTHVAGFLYDIGASYENSGNLKEALKYYNEYRTLKPDDKYCNTAIDQIKEKLKI